MIGDPLDLSWARRFGLWAAYAFGQPLPPAWPGIGRNAFAHESGIHADGVLKDRGNDQSMTTRRSGRSPPTGSRARAGWCSPASTAARPGSGTSSTGSGITVADDTEDLVFSLVQLCASATGKPLTDGTSG